MENQVLSISQMEELVNLRIDTSKASMCYATLDNEEYLLETNALIPNKKQLSLLGGVSISDKILTFTLQDILKILPKPCYINCIDDDFYQCEVTTKNGSTTTNGSSPLKAAFKMLKHCKINNYI